MSASPSDPLEMLREKAMLLLRRERDLHELQLERGRSEAWLTSFHRLSHGLPSATNETLFHAWTAALVDGLGFQIAGIYRYVADQSELLLQAGRAHTALKTSIELGRPLGEHFRAQSSGQYFQEAPAALGTVAQHLQFANFIWQWQSTRDQELLLLAGFSAHARPSYQYSPQELEHFTLFGTYLCALLDNVALIRDLDRERAELLGANRHLDQSLQELRETEVQLVQSAAVISEVSRRAGMADVATGVLHDVGNVLNSINISAQVSAERVAKLRTTGLIRVLELLGVNVDPERSALRPGRIVNYLRRLSEYLEAEKSALFAELSSMQQHIDHVKQVIAKQQGHVHALEVLETCNVEQIVDDALSLAAESLKRYDVEVVRNYEPLPPMRLDRHRVLQVMANLISNAVYAVRVSKVEQRQITATVAGLPPSQIQISISDNGIGIAQEHIPRLFNHGFTTKESGHGFGLHSSAIAAKELGGELRGMSLGLEQGATFSLVLPIADA